ncbi:MAG: host attachment protein [Gammaproteobacteria bacterium]|nr:host attachment protein [Gammaproteobacteria bacterium]
MGSYIVLAADQARARLFKSEKREGALLEITGMANPEARLREQDLVSDASGGNPHDIGNHDSAHQHVAEVFAKQVGQALEQALQAHKPDRIYVLASPSFLGLLRPHWSTALKGKIAQEFAKDVSRMPAEQIRSYLPELL